VPNPGGVGSARAPPATVPWQRPTPGSAVQEGEIPARERHGHRLVDELIKACHRTSLPGRRMRPLQIPAGKAAARAGERHLPPPPVPTLPEDRPPVSRPRAGCAWPGTTAWCWQCRHGIVGGTCFNARPRARLRASAGVPTPPGMLPGPSRLLPAGRPRPRPARKSHTHRLQLAPGRTHVGGRHDTWWRTIMRPVPKTGAER
jgi:hypothetical protein